MCMMRAGEVIAIFPLSRKPESARGPQTLHGHLHWLSVFQCAWTCHTSRNFCSIIIYHRGKYICACAYVIAYSRGLKVIIHALYVWSSYSLSFAIAGMITNFLWSTMSSVRSIRWLAISSLIWMSREETVRLGMEHFSKLV